MSKTGPTKHFDCYKSALSFGWEGNMPLFFLHFLSSNGVLIKDDIGEELTDLGEAEAYAIKSSREILSDQIKHPKDNALEAVLITDEQGEELRRIKARDLLPEPLR